MANYMAWIWFWILIFIGFFLTPFLIHTGPFSSSPLVSSYSSGVLYFDLNLPFHKIIRTKYNELSGRYNLNAKVQKLPGHSQLQKFRGSVSQTGPSANGQGAQTGQPTS